MINRLFADAEPVAPQQDLAQLEAIIERGLETFVDVGMALLAIRDRKLYKQSHFTFEEYCKERWGMSRSYAHRTIEAAQVASNLLPIGNIPATESQVRPLTNLEPEEQREVWSKAVDTAPDGRVTAAHVQSIVDEHAVLKAKTEYWSPTPTFEYEEPAEEFYQPTKPHVTHNSGNNEWGTPAIYIEAARRVLGEIDLDPASNDVAQETVQAATYYTVDTDGLAQEWRGRVWMNPPYSSNLIGAFVTKLTKHVEVDEVTEAIVLVNNATDTQWFQALAEKASAICFPKRRIRFAGSGDSGPLQGQAFVYIGKNDIRFVAEFGRYGFSVAVL